MGGWQQHVWLRVVVAAVLVGRIASLWRELAKTMASLLRSSLVFAGAVTSTGGFSFAGVLWCCLSF
jgi:hypothetical protein